MKESLTQLIQNFAQNDLRSQSLKFFKTLGYTSERRIEEDGSPETFLENYDAQQRFNRERGLFAEWQKIYLLFQLTDNEIKPVKPMFQATDQRIDNSIIESFLFIALELKQARYSRTDLAKITRAINQIFAMPAILLFKHGETLTLSVIQRRLHKRDDSQDVLEKVTVLKDIRIANPHRAHLDILTEFALENLKPSPVNFVELFHAWQSVLNTKELNKKFYKELSQWYFWASKQVIFPNPEQIDLQRYHAQSLIRLLTRLLFVWFVKEKQLVPDELFEKSDIEKLLQTDHPSRYYRAILQNLFFATLNQIRGQRQFRRPGQNMNVTNLMRYQSYFKNPEQFLTLLENVVPFMNGGLFECLDKPIPDKKGKQGGDVIAYYDGFSDREDNVLAVPDFIFFGRHQADLSDELGNSYKSVEIKGLIDVLKAYKFTVTENTPLEEDVALDPELLGQVFENLLASYNPETGETARKATGSYYTPREIVDYMVDESLIAYFAQAGTPDKLRVLFNYATAKNPFNPEETQVLITAIDTCKILDPACGSGAFPMGVLHKLVHALHQLDPQNRLWKERQLEKAQLLDDTPIREQLIDDIETAFENNELDYGRKLYLIENCIYGVDIQPIAVQISKLRFFISLIVEQKVNAQKDNFGIRPLPNLETKFVAANTLIGIKKPELQRSLFEKIEIGKLETQLKEVRHRSFSAKTPSTKRKLRDEDKALREKIGELLEKHGFEHQTALQLAQWNPYDQNASADFFDSEWMFGIKAGFDVVLGNPPYIRQEAIKHLKADLKNYQVYTGTSDLYTYFYESGFNLLKENGILAFITSNKWMRTKYGEKLREFFLTRTTLLQLIDFKGKAVFDATVDANILLFKKGVQALLADEQAKPALLLWVGEDLPTVEKPLQSLAQSCLNKKAFVLGDEKVQALKAKIEAMGTPLKEWDVKIYRGVLTGFNEAFIINTAKKEQLCREDPKSVEIIKPILRGRDIKRYGYEWAGLWLINSHNNPPVNIDDYPAIKKHLNQYYPQLEKRLDKGKTPYNLRNCAYLQEFEREKVVWKRVGSVLRFGYDNEGLLSLDSTCLAIGRDIKYLIALLNSKVSFYQLLQNSPKTGTGDVITSVQALEPLLLPKISESKQRPFIELVDKILAAKKAGEDTSLWEREIDRLVYQLYDLTAEEIAVVEG